MTHNSKVSRRSFLKSVAAGAGAVSTPAVLTACGGDDDDDNGPVFSFGHGVASGDPLSDRVIIWTRITSDRNVEAITVDWSVATDASMANVVASGQVDTDATVDYTVKVDAEGLSADTTYYYQFSAAGVSSVIGETKTLPTGDVSNVKLAVCSCSNFAFGNFNVYKEISKAGADVVVHLGDYIYEYRSGVYPDADNIAENRQPDPQEEIITLDQYRARYNQYRRDADLQAAHQNTPFICVWDDHELANDAYKDGAQNHSDDEGSFADRRAAAFQAYHEWLPIRTESDRSVIDRSFDFGDLLSLHMMDTRQVARTKSLSYSDFNFSGSAQEVAAEKARLTQALKDTNSTLLGAEQEQRVFNRLSGSTATWQVLGQQVLMGRMMIPAEIQEGLTALQEELEKETPDTGLATQLQNQIRTSLTELFLLKGSDPSNARLTDLLPYNLDAWDGYSAARETILNQAKMADANLVVLAGDTHNAWANELYTSDANGVIERADGPVGVEFATSSVTSPGFDSYISFGSEQEQGLFELAVTTLVDDLKYMNAVNRGYTLVEFTKEKATCEWRFVSTIQSTDYQASVAKKMEVLPGAGNRTLEDVALPAS